MQNKKNTFGLNGNSFWRNYNFGDPKGLNRENTETDS